MNAVASGGTVNVAAGAYAEDVMIAAAKGAVDLAGEGSATTTIKGVALVDAISWPLADPNIEILADGVKLHGFTVESPDAAAGFYSSGVVIGGANVEIYGNAFRVADAASLDDVSQALQTYRDAFNPTGGDLDGLRIHDNTFTSFRTEAAGFEAIFINHVSAGAAPAGTVTIANNTFSGAVLRAITTERSKTDITGNTVTTTLAVENTFQGMQVRDYDDRDVASVLVSANQISGFR